MPISWNEVRDRARQFSKTWEGETSENAEAKTFWDEFFKVFGISRKRVASFELPVKASQDRNGFVDLLWKGVLIVEHKSAGKNLDRATRQALDYFPGIKERDLPRYVVVSDFSRFRLYDLECPSGATEFTEFPLKDLYKHIKAFGFMLGFPTQKVRPEAAVNLKAVQRLSTLHDQLEAERFAGKNLEVFLTRLVFCFFAEDTSIFERSQFQEWVSSETREDGADLGGRLNELFEVLNTPESMRSTLLPEVLAAFPYVNGGIFADRLPTAPFNTAMREALLLAASLDWGQISPAIFGALFQGLMSKADRRRLGAHYTREQNILRVIKPMFLDELWREFNAAKHNKSKLNELHVRLRGMKFFDPACGCGNFLVVTYRELRLLEIEILRAFYNSANQQMLPVDLDHDVWLNVDMFYGIEIDEKAAQIARLAMWLTDHQMNLAIGEEFGTYFRRLPLITSANITFGNALAIPWRDLLDPTSGSVYVIGNPPFIGSKNMDDGQRLAVNAVFGKVEKSGTLDFVAAWYVLAAEYIADTDTRVAFVSTNSIVQGEQVGVLWSWMLGKGCKIQFCHRTFQWSNEARGVAAVHCVVIGFGLRDIGNKVIFTYDDIRGEPIAVPAKNINPYLVDYADIVLRRRRYPLSDVPSIGVGNKPIDGGFYLFTTPEKAEFLANEPKAEPFFYKWIGSKEFLNGIERWCLLLRDCPPAKLRSMPLVMERIEAVQKFRRGTGPNSDGEFGAKPPPLSTKKMADTPLRFHVENFPTARYLVLPETSSERRRYIPLGFEEPSTLASSLVRVAAEATSFHFGVLSSAMHNAWIKYTCGRLKSDYRYSVSVVFNNFPWPTQPSEKNQTAVSTCAEDILLTRSAFPNTSLADLYDPISMPEQLLAAHQRLDRAVDALYGKPRGFKGDDERVAFLFSMYETLLAAKEISSDTSEPIDMEEVDA